MEYFGFWVTHNDVKSIYRKIEAINNMKPPTNQKEVNRFKGVINYHRNMWPMRSHQLAPLTGLTYIRRKFK